MSGIELGAYDATEVEAKWRKAWDESGVYNWNPAIPRDQTFVIDTPPPTVSGALHMGHMYSYTQTDILARYMRMSGLNVFYPIGYDDNGLPTERLVEKRREVKAANMGREEFTKICLEVAGEARADFRDLFGRMGMSYDWNQQYSTIEPRTVKLSQMSLLDLYAKGHLYRSGQPAMWDPVDRTGIAQAEVVEKETKGVMFQIPFSVNGEQLIIATTRPELLAACVAVMYHPSHAKAAQFKGQKAVTPLFGIEVPLIADEAVNPEKGTGVVMCCTFGDPTDVEWWRTHSLPLRNIVQQNGKLGNMGTIGEGDWKSVNPAKAKEIAAKITDQNVRAAKATMVELLKAEGLILAEQEVMQMIPCAERSGAPLELIPTSQWMVRLIDKKEQMIALGRQLNWKPEYMRARFEDWVNNLKWDWLISRQRYFGVPIPFWYSKRKGEEGKIIAASIDELPVNPLSTPPKGYTMDEVEPDRDVLDTWGTSSISPQINSGAITEELAVDLERHHKLFPADLRPQAHEIIRTWLFYTIAKSMLHTGQLPWKNAAISGWCLAEDRSKMSKSKGNGITPQDLLTKHSADIIRYWTATGRLGHDTAFSEVPFGEAKRLVNKLWNASKLVAPNMVEAPDKARITSVVDRWMLSHLYRTVEQATAFFADYNYTQALEVAEQFFWKTYCDNYLEIAKGRLYGEQGTAEEQLSAKHALTLAHRIILGLFAPFTVNVTEELYSKLFAAEYSKEGSLHRRGNWPKASALLLDEKAMAEGDMIIDALTAVRRMKAALKISMKADMGTLEVAAGENCPDDAWAQMQPALADLANVTHVAGITWHIGEASGEWHASDSGKLKVRATVAQAA